MDVEFLLMVLLYAMVLVGPFVAIILSIIAIVMARRAKGLQRRVEQLEATIYDRAASVPISELPPVVSASGESEPSSSEALIAADASAPESAVSAFDWERFVGQRALGWVATTLLVFAVAFFLRYAFQNDWVGPLGRVATSAMIGCALTIGGHYYFRRGWRVFSQSLVGAGVVVLYLASYSAFEFYDLLPPQHAGVFLALIIIESMILAVIYDSVAIGIVAVVGGLVTPLLLHTGQDSYRELFTYLALLNAGSLVVLALRRWPVIGAVSLLGTHGLYWIWFAENYHPEKLDWSLGFQLTIFGLYLAYAVVEQLIRRRSETWEGLMRVILTPALSFLALYFLLERDYQVWMGSMALLMASIYAGLGRATLTLRPRDRSLLLAFLAVSMGFIALSFPIQADAHWVALGWAATGAALWWFGHRISAASLRVIASLLLGAAVSRVLFFDLASTITEPFWPVLNEFALPSSCVALCLILAGSLTWRYCRHAGATERRAVAFGILTGILLLWLVLTIDCYHYFDVRARLPRADRVVVRWLGQLTVSVFWAVFASTILAVGFRMRLAPLRWLAIAMYGATVTKVLLVDMANLQQFYRILAFLILAVVLGLATRAYQRLGTSQSNAGDERIST